MNKAKTTPGCPFNYPRAREPSNVFVGNFMQPGTYKVQLKISGIQGPQSAGSTSTQRTGPSTSFSGNFSAG